MDHDTNTVDVTLLLEGTYPFVRGGVSTWVHDLIIGLPEFTFSLVYLGAEKPREEKLRYELPSNVSKLHCHYLMDDGETTITPQFRWGNEDYFAAVKELHEWFHHPDTELAGAVFDEAILEPSCQKSNALSDFLYSVAAWDQITERYLTSCPDVSFLAYFWTIRNTHAPFFKLIDIAKSLPASRIFHAVSTGYAGFLGALLKRRTQSSYVLTEHGIYTKERKIDLQAMFLQDRRKGAQTIPESGMQYHEQLWLRTFEGMGRLAYAAAQVIISLYDKNQERQIRDGADPKRVHIIPNGVNVERFLPLRAKRADIIPPILGLIGRIVQIKDIKTFIRTIHALQRDMPEAEGWLIGPEDEDPVYVEECKALVKSLELNDKVKFLGFQRIEDILPQLGLLALTSISEAFPLVIGEAHASGLPVVATDVGACRVLIEGGDEKDRALGHAGSIVPICDPVATARAAYNLLGDKERWYAAQQAGILRVERYYRHSQVIESYRDIYQTVGNG